MRRGSRDNIERCDRCAFRIERCICDRFSFPMLVSRVMLIVHDHDLLKPSNTGRVLSTCIEGCIVHKYGFKGHVLDYTKIAGENPVILYPHGDSVVLTREYWESLDSPTLTVIDGTWSQASKQANKLLKITSKFVRLPERQYPSYLLRNSGEKNRLCTAQATIEALKIIGEDTSSLQSFLNLFISENLKLRGRQADLSDLYM